MSVAGTMFEGCTWIVQDLQRSKYYNLPTRSNPTLSFHNRTKPKNRPPCSLRQNGIHNPHVRFLHRRIHGSSVACTLRRGECWNHCVAWCYRHDTSCRPSKEYIHNIIEVQPRKDDRKDTSKKHDEIQDDALGTDDRDERQWRGAPIAEDRQFQEHKV